MSWRGLALLLCLEFRLSARSPWGKRDIVHAGPVSLGSIWPLTHPQLELLSNVVFQKVDLGGGFGGGGFGFLCLMYGLAPAVDEFLALQ